MFALADCNNFFVSCERVFDASLKGNPVAVMSNNDGCVISRSNELKALGVQMCTPLFQLRDLIPKHKIIVKSANFALYSDFSVRVMNTLGEFTPDLEIYSIDEAFLTLSLSDASQYEALGHTIRNRVLKVTGIPTGIGIAVTKTLAKIANHIAKKSGKGVYVLCDSKSVLDNLPVGDVWGIGRRSSETLRKLGIKTASALCELDREFILRHFSINMLRTVEELKGIPVFETLDAESASQSITVSRSFGRPVTTLPEMVESVAVYTSQAAAKLRAESLRASGITVCFQYYSEHGFTSTGTGMVSLPVTFPEPLSDTSEMMRYIRPVLSRLFESGRRYKKSCVICFGLCSENRIQQDFFAVSKPQNEKLYATIDALNRKFGKRTLFHLSEGINPAWMMRSEHRSPAYTTNWKEIPEVH